MGIVNPNGGNGSGDFQPNTAVKRAAVAAFAARTFGWQQECHRNNFPDRCDAKNGNCVDSEIWSDIAALKDYGIVGGYTDTDRPEPRSFTRNLRQNEKCRPDLVRLGRRSFHTCGALVSGSVSCCVGC